MKVGILGGTFDPIHLGHMAVARAAIECAGLDQVVLMPAGQPPHRGPTFASAVERLEMARLAAAADGRIKVSEIEVSRAGPSYTVDSLRALGQERPDDEHHLILGWDAAREIRSWRDSESVLEAAPLVVLARPGLPVPETEDLLRAGLDPAHVRVCREATPDIESTEIRRRASAGESLEGLVDPRVEDYIRERRLYSLLASGR